MLNNKLKIKYGLWLEESGPHSGVVISTRMRLARNLKGFFFPSRASARQLEEIKDVIKEAVQRSSFLKKFVFVFQEELDEIDRLILTEEYLVSPGFFSNNAGRAVILSPDGKVSLMVNEEDHLRIQTLFSGLRLTDAWSLTNEVDESLSTNLEYAFDERWGYLSSCPTNMGTGLRASVMVHLPALVLTGQMQGIISALVNQNLAVRGLFGEGTRATGNMYQISNQVTLGKSEEEIIEILSGVCDRIIRSELAARKQLVKERKNQLVDRICRAKGILEHAHMLNFEEAVELLSMVWLGAEIGLVSDLKNKSVGKILFWIGSGHVQALLKKPLSEEEVEQERANIIRERLLI